MERNIIGDLLILKQLNIKPNFSELARIYDMDRHTVAKYWRNGGIKHMERKSRKSILDQYEEEIRTLLKKPGQQLQVDWKENLKITTVHGEAIEFNIMTSTLGYSREHIFIYTKGKTTEDFLRCIIDTLNRLGGAPEYILTDNMTAVVSITNGTKRKHEKIKAFENDTGIKIRLCKTRSPQTKGKDESANRFISWLNAYDGEIRDEGHLIELIERLNMKVNSTVNQTTNVPPHVLFKKEKEYLKPLPSKVLLDSYVDHVITQTVPPTLLVTYKGSGYSVPTKLINKRVKMIPIENKLYIYFNTELITVHQINQNKFNYHLDHYQEALHKSIHNKEVDIDAVAQENLKLMERIVLICKLF